MNHIPSQLSAAGPLLASAFHIVFTTGGNDLDIEQSISQIIFNNNFATVWQTKLTLLKLNLF
jgi:hypothetical protein